MHAFGMRSLLVLGCLSGSIATVFRKASARDDPHVRDSEANPPPYRADTSLDFLKGSLDTDGESPVATVSTEVPQTFSKFMEGLMWRQQMDDSQSMLFRWNRDGPRSFWMENTYIGLDIVYVNHENRVVSIVQGKAKDLSSIPSAQPASYAVEVPLGWCQRHGVEVGDRIRFHDLPDSSFVARDAQHFGASPEEVRAAVSDGNYDPN